MPRTLLLNLWNDVPGLYSEKELLSTLLAEVKATIVLKWKDPPHQKNVSLAYKKWKYFNLEKKWDGLK